VSNPLDTKGKREVWLCGADGALRRVMRTVSDASERNRGLDHVGRGDLVRCLARRRVRHEDGFDVVSNS
jgi:hypothetical protein